MNEELQEAKAWIERLISVGKDKFGAEEADIALHRLAVLQLEGAINCRECLVLEARRESDESREFCGHCEIVRGLARQVLPDSPRVARVVTGAVQ